MSDEQDDDVDAFVPSEEIRAAVVALENEHGRLTPEYVLEEAAIETSPLHGCFEWDDSVAAHKHRLDQARRLIRSVKVVVTTTTRVISTVRYGRDPQAAPGQGYVSVEQLRSEPDNARAFLRHEFSRAAAHLRRAEDLAEVLGLRHEVTAVRQSVEMLSKGIQPEA